MKATRSAIVFIEQGNSILLAQRSEAVGWAPGFWQAPGGKAEKGETFEDAVVREVKEEVNIDITRASLRLRGLIDYTEGPYEDIDIVVFACSEWSGEPTIMEPQKCSSLGWFKVGNLPDNILDDAKIFLQNPNDGLYIKMKNDKVVEYES